jgi:hypothetical protein
VVQIEVVNPFCIVATMGSWGLKRALVRIIRTPPAAASGLGVVLDVGSGVA